MKQRRSRDKSTPRTAFRLETLERRILLSADLPFVAEGFTSVDPNGSQFVSTHNSDDASNNSDTSDPSASETASLPTVELVIIDSSTPDYLSIFEDLQQSSSSRVEIFVLDSDRDGIEQITELLAPFSNVIDLHVITHGEDGQITLGNSSVGLVDLLVNADQVAGWQDSFAADADLLIYGSDLTATDAGRNFVATLGQLTSVGVAASADLTGHDFVATVPFLQGADSSVVADEQRLELVFVDTDTPDYQQLVDDLLLRPDDGRRIEVIKGLTSEEASSNPVWWS